MNNECKVVIANPAGNITIMVLTPTPRERYQEVANKLLDMDFGPYCDWADSVHGEQVAFVLPLDDRDKDTLPKIDMCGLEFCGNAARAFAYYRVAQCGDPSETMINISGYDRPLHAFVNLSTDVSMIEMPIPTGYRELPVSTILCTDNKGNETVDNCSSEPTGILVNMDGIAHLVLTGVEPSEDNFNLLKAYVYDNLYPDLPAFGSMFIEEISQNVTMTPVVYVRDVNTTYFEGSCASGTTAAAFALALKMEDGEFDLRFQQPEGYLDTHITKIADKIKQIDLAGEIGLSEVVTVNL